MFTNFDFPAAFDRDAFERHLRETADYVDGLSPDGYDYYGFDCMGYDRNGFDISGYDFGGFDRDGLNHEGITRSEAAMYNDQSMWG